MNITKSSLTVDGNSVHMSMPFAKVDQEKRTVSGYATLNNIDSQGDVVTVNEPELEALPATKLSELLACGGPIESWSKLLAGELVKRL